LISSSYDANADDLFITLSWQKLNRQRELKTATMVYKSLIGLALDYLKLMFTDLTDRSAISTYSLRKCEGKLAVPLPRINFLKNSFGYSGVVLWNSLPANLRQAQTVASFKSGCRGFISDSDEIELITRHSWKAGTLLLLLFLFLLLLDLVVDHL